jgi:hypothetical protein
VDLEKGEPVSGLPYSCCSSIERRDAAFAAERLNGDLRLTLEVLGIGPTIDVVSGQGGASEGGNAAEEGHGNGEGFQDACHCGYSFVGFTYQLVGIYLPIDR